MQNNKKNSNAYDSFIKGIKRVEQKYRKSKERDLLTEARLALEENNINLAIDYLELFLQKTLEISVGDKDMLELILKHLYQQQKKGKRIPKKKIKVKLKFFLRKIGKRIISFIKDILKMLFSQFFQMLVTMLINKLRSRYYKNGHTKIYAHSFILRFGILIS